MGMPISRTSTYTLACETPLLRGQKPLCEFLEQMDKDEQNALAQDEKHSVKNVIVFIKNTMPLKF
jgi:hypothetical protein